MTRRNLSSTISLTLFIILLTFSMAINADEQNNTPLRCVAYNLELIPHLGIISDEGRLLVWKGPVKGDIYGYVVWWFDLPMKDPLIQEEFALRFYSGRWEIHDSDPFGGCVFRFESYPQARRMSDHLLREALKR